MLKEGTTDQPGRWRNSYYPWLPEIADTPTREPHLSGFIHKKAGQTGGSENGVNMTGWALCTRPRPMLYLTTTDDQAREFSRDRFDYMMESAPVLKTRRIRGWRGDSIHVKRFIGAKLAIWGSGSPSKMMSEPYGIVELDELDRLPNFPGIGSAWALAGIRTRTFRPSWIWAWSTPTLEDALTESLWTTITDQRRFHVGCSKCAAVQWLKWGQVRIDNRDPETARYACESCGEFWTDGERARSVFGGFYKSTIDPAEAKRKRFAGYHISRLYDPYMPLSELARAYVNCASEHDLQVFHNSDLGEAYTPSAAVLTDEDFASRIGRMAEEPAPDATLFITAGVDVQHQIACYFDISGWTKGAEKVLLLYGIVRGWERLREALRAAEFPTADGRTLKVKLAAIDAGYESSQVYHFCQAMGGNVIPTRYATVQYGQQWRAVNVETANNITLYLLERTYWMDRALGRFGGKEELAGVVLPGGISDEYKAHILANRRIETIDRRSGYRKALWELPRGMHDDYLQAAVNAEFAAHLCGLDRLETEGKDFRAKRTAMIRQLKEEQEREPWIRRDHLIRRGKWITDRR